MEEIEQLRLQKQKLYDELCNKREYGLRRVKNEFEEGKKRIEDLFNSSQNSLEERYNIRAAGVMARSLSAGNEALNNGVLNAQCCAIRDLPEDTMNKAKNISDQIRKEKNPESAKRMREIVRDLDSSERFNAALDYLLGPRHEPRQIISYVSFAVPAPHELEVYILSPIREENGKEKLEKGLEAIVTNIISEGKVSSGSNVDIDESGCASRVNLSTIQFTADFNYSNNFLVYILKINKEDSGTAQLALNALKNSFEKTQPVGFKEAGLTHRLEEVEYGVMQYFMSNNIQQIQQAEKTEPFAPQTSEEHITLSEAARLIGRSPAAIRTAIKRGHITTNSAGTMCNYNSVMIFNENKDSLIRPVQARTMLRTSEEKSEWREKSLQELVGFESSGQKYLSTSEAAQVLHLSKSYLLSIKREGGIIPYESERNKNRVLFEISSLKTFIETHNPVYIIQKPAHIDAPLETRKPEEPQIQTRHEYRKQSELRRSALEKLEASPLGTFQTKDVANILDICYSAAYSAVINNMTPDKTLNHGKKIYIVTRDDLKTYIKNNTLPRRRDNPNQSQ